MNRLTVRINFGKVSGCKSAGCPNGSGVCNTKDTPLSEIKQELIEHLKILIQDKKNFSNKHKIKNALVKFELFDKKENKKHGIILLHKIYYFLLIL